MKSSPTMWLSIGILIGGAVAGATVVLAQEPSYNPPRPVDVQNGSSCQDHAVKHLLVAADPLKRADQDWNLKTAEAYERLAALGFQEC